MTRLPKGWLYLLGAAFYLIGTVVVAIAWMNRLRSDFDTTGWGPTTVREHVHRAVLAIEAEAAALTIERLVDEAEASGKPAIVKWVEGILPRLDGLTRVG